MNKALFLLLSLPCVLSSEEPVCKKCEVIREYNKEHPGDYEYYEDYLDAEGKNKPEQSKPSGK